MEYSYKILDLLVTAEAKNIRFAYQLLQSYKGEENLTELYLMYFITEDKELREELRLLLSKHASPEFVNFSNHLEERSEWAKTYILRGNINSFLRDKTLDVQKVLYFFKHLLLFKDMHPSIKGLFLEYGTDQEIEEIIKVSKKKIH